MPPTWQTQRPLVQTRAYDAEERHVGNLKKMSKEHLYVMGLKEPAAKVQYLCHANVGGIKRGLPPTG